ncbi:MAG: amidase [Gemmatimonadaceae bacterium]
MRTQAYDRREFMEYFTSVGLGATLLPGTLWAQVEGGAEITAATVKCAEEIAGLSLDEAEREMMVAGLRVNEARIRSLHAIVLSNSESPALVFSPLPPGKPIPAEPTRQGARETVQARALPRDLEELAFAPVTELAELIRVRRITATQLTTMYLARIKRLDPSLRSVITLTEERARAQAASADAEIASGKYRGPLHGIPWGAKDLLAVRGYRTTWGAGPYRDQVIDEDATVVQRLDAAGAVLLGKLSLGELAQGDVWFDGMTRNPWKIDQGSSGSSAGPAAATAAGLVAFSIGSETLGSISSPATRCGATGLRPTYGRVPKTGAMALSWTMDKLGPICRSADDCALVLEAISGTDGMDQSAVAQPFVSDFGLRLPDIRVGYFKGAFDVPERDPADPGRTLHSTKKFDDDALDVLRGLGIALTAVELPQLPYDAMRIILTAEAAAAFDALTRSNRDELLVQQTRNDWANTFRVARFIPAVDYINANRLRARAIAAWDELFARVDVVVTPTAVVGFPQLVATNLTGHPAVILPHGFRADGTPVSLTFLGSLFGEARLLTVAGAYQRSTDFHLRHPPI